jgi:hypothetical protein
VTDPYGTERGPQSSGLGDPGNQGPQFVAPGAYGQAPSQSPYGPPPYPQGPPPFPQGPPPYLQAPSQPYPQGPQQAYPGAQQASPGPQQAYPPGPQQPGYGYPRYGPGPQQPHGPVFTPPRRPQPRRSSAPVVVVVVLAILAGVLVGGYELYRSATGGPATQPTPTRPTRPVSLPPVVRATGAASAQASQGMQCEAGDRITTDTFVAIVPASWSCDGDDGDVSITSTRSDAIWVEHDAGSGDPTGDCKAQLDGLGDLMVLPPETWGGKPALAFEAVESGDIFGVRCVVVGSQTWYLMYFPLDAGDEAAVRADVTSLLSTWLWK